MHALFLPEEEDSLKHAKTFITIMITMYIYRRVDCAICPYQRLHASYLVVDSGGGSSGGGAARSTVDRSVTNVVVVLVVVVDVVVVGVGHGATVGSSLGTKVLGLVLGINAGAVLVIVHKTKEDVQGSGQDSAAERSMKLVNKEKRWKNELSIATFRWMKTRPIGGSIVVERANKGTCSKVLTQTRRSSGQARSCGQRPRWRKHERG